MQASDPTLDSVWERAQDDDGESTQYFQRNGLLYRKWLPPRRGGTTTMAVEQLVLPSSCRVSVLKVAHTIPIAVHLGRDKTTDRILQKFYWPTLFQDIARYCHTCGPCQKSSSERPPPVPPLANIGTAIYKDCYGHHWSVTQKPNRKSVCVSNL